MTSHTMRAFVRAIVLVFASTVVSPAMAGEASPYWVYETTGGYLDSSPAIADLDGDDSPDVCIASLAGPVFALNAFGREIWKTDVDERITIAPTIADVTGDPMPEVLVLTQSGRLFCLEGRSGDVVWAYNVATQRPVDLDTAPTEFQNDSPPIKHGGTTIVASDIDNDGSVEIITNTVTGSLVCVDATGSLRWAWEAGEDLPAAPAAGDLDGDGIAEVVVATLEHPAVCLSAAGEVQWKYAADESLTNVGRDTDIASPVIVDLDGDGTSEVVTYDETVMVALNALGEPVWKTVAARQRVDASLTVADADQDGSPEVYAIDLTGDVVRVNADGTLMWTRNVGMRARRGFSVADADGDGVNEILVGAYTGKIHILNPDGEIETELSAASGTNATSSVADLAGDRGVCVVTPEISGNLTVYRWVPGDKASTILVPGYRGGNARTASAYEASADRKRVFSRIDLGNSYARNAEFVVETGEPADIRREVTISIADETGVVDEESRTVPAGRHRDLKIRYDGTRLTGNAVFTCSVAAGDDAIESHTFTVPVFPYRETLGSLREQMDRIGTLLAGLPDASGVEERHAFLAASLHNIETSTGELSRLTGLARRQVFERVTMLADDMNALEALASAADDAGSSLTVSAANPWAPFGGIDELAEDRMGGDRLAVGAFGGEVESAALNVWNFSGSARMLKVTMSALENGDASVSDAIILREVVSVGTQRAKMVADALPELGEGSTIMVPAWGVRQLWLEIHTDGLSAGDWTSDVTLRDLDISAEEVSAPLTVTVWPVAQSREHIFDMCGWADTSPPGVLEDMLSHGMNVFTDAHAVPFEFDADGKIVSADFSELDEYMTVHAPVGTAMFHSFVRLTGPADPFEPAWLRAYDAAIKQFVARVEELGFGYDDYAYYPVDEPGLDNGRRVDQFVKWASITHEADPDIRIYTNPVLLKKEWREAMDPYVDIYAPMHAGSWHRNPEMQEQVEVMHSRNRTMWTYTCADNVKHLSPLGYNRAQTWMCFNIGHTGGGFWTYFSRSEPGWKGGGYDYSLVYSGTHGSVPSKRWEALRDGTEDYSMLMALKTAMNAPDADPALVERARALLEGDVVAVGNFDGMDDDGIVPGKDGDPGVRKVADKRFATITEVRHEMRDLLLAFGESGR